MVAGKQLVLKDGYPDEQESPGFWSSSSLIHGFRTSSQRIGATGPRLRTRSAIGPAGRGSESFFGVGVPSRIGPPPMLPDKDLSHAARTR
jgi:hypothetical protein